MSDPSIPHLNYTKNKLYRLKQAPPNFATLRDRLTFELNNQTCECPICCSPISRNSRIWSCPDCHNVYHIPCVREWAVSSSRDGTWACPSCKSTHLETPNAYRCFCGKVSNPPVSSETAHSCGEVCGRLRRCGHKCLSLCHPGDCPTCLVSVERSCFCGRESGGREACRGRVGGFSCGGVCERRRGCGHSCGEECHMGDCGECREEIEVTCFCGKATERVQCGRSRFACRGECGRLMGCGVHTCGERCHRGGCPPCRLHIENNTTCACGRTPIGDLFVEKAGILSEIPTCGLVCGRDLPCGGFDVQNKPHMCPLRCHVGECPPFCTRGTLLGRCNCSRTTRVATCEEAANKRITCPTPCQTRKNCKRHTCPDFCCARAVHECDKVCGRDLNCKKHVCEEMCHPGKCRPCPRLNFDELSCFCGQTVIFPPSPCGTSLPTCSFPCSREHVCSHRVSHDCHYETTCPPCTARIRSTCFGGHKELTNVLCYLESSSCGERCARLLGCGRHRCPRTCHRGTCGPCGQPCSTRRSDCAHTCGSTCGDHEECCAGLCREMVEVRCPCGSRVLKRECHLGGETTCVDECIRARRVRAMVEAFGVPDFSLSYLSESFLETAKQNIKFVRNVETKLSELVRSVVDGRELSVVHHFPVMSYERCVIVGKMAEYYGCEAEMYDSEPNMNTTVIARKGKCLIPNTLLSDACCKK